MQKAIEIQNRNLALRGVLQLPGRIAGKAPAVILFHGFGGNKMGPYFIFVRLSRILADLGIASLRFDFAGSGESDGEFVDMTLTGELEDAEAILDYARTLDFIDRDRIGVTGFSMGGAVASLLAGSRRGDIRSLCLWAPAGNIAEIVINDFIDEHYADFLRKGYHEFEGQMIGKNFVEDIRNIDIYGKASGYDGRVLLLHGDSDEVVNLRASERYLDYYGNKAALKVISGADHMFGRQVWKQQLLRYTTEFFLQELQVDWQRRVSV